MNNYLIKFKYTGDDYDLLDLVRVNGIKDKNYLSYMLAHNFYYVKNFGYKCVSRSYLKYGDQFLDQKKQSEEFIVIFDMNFNFEFSERSRILLPIIETIRDYKISRVLL